MEKKITRKQYSKFAKKWYRKFIKFDSKKTYKDIAYNTDQGLLLAILYTVLYYRDSHIGYPSFIDPDGVRPVAENIALWDEELDQLIDNIIYLVDNNLWDDKYRNKYDIVMDKLKELLPVLWK